MKNVCILKHCLLYITIFFAFCFANAAEKIKVACVGDSITAGSGIKDAGKNSYPKQLQNILGDNYDVRNFGVSGRTLLKKGDYPYWNENAFKNAKEFLPNIVIIKLGTNDSKPQNMAHAEDFYADYSALVEEFQNLPSKPTVYLALPVYVVKQSWGINQTDLLHTIIPALKKAAKDKNVEVIDLQTPTYMKAEFYADGVHPNNYGASIMAQEIARVIKKEAQTFAYPKKTFPAPQEEWAGFKMYKWEFATHVFRREAIVVEPKVAAEGKPWIWRPAFFGHEPQTDIALLNLGYHVVYLDVTNDYGSPQAVKFGADFHKYLVDEFNFAPKAVMEGMSRGGYYSLRFACTYPQKVASLYLDAPACDMLAISVWTNSNAWKDVLNKWKISEEEAKTFPGNPMNHLEDMVKEKIAIISVCGDADDVVPLKTNSEVLKEKYTKLGGVCELIVKPGIGHHPHSLKDPKPIVDFIIKHQPNYDKAKYLKKLETENAKTKSETKAPNQFTEHLKIRGSLDNSKIKFESGKATVAFVGGSITEMKGWKDIIKEDLKKRFPKTEFTFIDAGLSSTGSTPHAFRLANDVFGKATPDLLFFEAVANDDVNGFSMNEQIKGVEGVIRQALIKNPNMDIIMLEFIHDGFIPKLFTNEPIEGLITHEKLAEYYNIPSIDLVSEMTQKMKNYELNWIAFGGTHPAPLGHKLYADSINKLFELMWGNSKATSLKAHKMPAQKMDKFSYCEGKFIDIKKTKIKNGFSIEETWEPKIKSGTRNTFVQVPMLSCDEAGSELTLEFTGTAIGIFCASGPEAGVLEYSVDNTEFKKLDTFTNWSGGLYIPWVFMFEKELPNKKHTLTLKMSAEKNPKSKGNAVHIRNFVVNGK